MNLIIDIGNTLIKAAVFDKGLITNMVKSESFSDALLQNLIKNTHHFEGIILSDVRQPDPEIDKQLSAITNLFIRLAPTIALPLAIDYKSPETLGMDRLALAVGANDLFPDQNVLVISCGTAITYDFITDSNRYPGGNISPGMAMRFRALHEYSGRLPLAIPGTPPDVFGKTTTEALQNGVILGIINEIEGVAETFSKPFPKLKVILTGGDADFFANRLKSPIFVDQYLLIKGLNRILEYNKGFRLLG